eukprot:216108_1
MATSLHTMTTGITVTSIVVTRRVMLSLLHRSLHKTTASRIQMPSYHKQKIHLKNTLTHKKSTENDLNSYSGNNEYYVCTKKRQTVAIIINTVTTKLSSRGQACPVQYRV